VTREIPAFIPVYQPDLSGNERDYVLECIDSSWISSIGSFIDRFEGAFAGFVRSPHAMSVSNGTVALHLAIHCLGIGPGDEVIVPTFTYIASVNTIAQAGATPVFVDCRPDDWLIDVEDVARKITSRTKAILPVHLYGAVCDMPPIMALARRHGLRVIEDCAEALGSTLGGQSAGTFGDVGTFSFFGNKTITTGEGGMVIAEDGALAGRMRRVKGQGQSLTRRYWHDELGFNYRMTNICAAIGLAQLERIETILSRKRAISDLYKASLSDANVTFQVTQQGVESSNWLVSLLLPPESDRDRVMTFMREHHVDSRPVFYCAHQMPMYHQDVRFTHSEPIAARGISLPSYSSLSDSDVRRVADTLRQALAAS
jgi:perosamine synthetase